MLARLATTLHFVGVRLLRQGAKDNCVQTVLAMALDLEVQTLEELAATDGPLRLGQILTLLGRMGMVVRPLSAPFAADLWSVFQRRRGGRTLRGIAFQEWRDDLGTGHAYLLWGSRIYDPATGEHRALTDDSLRSLDWLILLPRGARRFPAVEGLRDSAAA